MHFHLPKVPSLNDVVHQVKDAMKHHKHEKESVAHQVRQTRISVIYTGAEFY